MKTLVSTLLIVLFMVVLPVIVAYAGMFLEDFSDGNLDRWHIVTAPGPPFPVTELLKIENGHLVIDTMLRGELHLVSLELKTGNPKKWDSYTLTCRIRFKSEIAPQPPSTFKIEVRHSNRWVQKNPLETVPVTNSQVMWIDNDRRQEIKVWSFEPDPAELANDIHIPREEFQLERLERPIWDRWIPIKIVAKEEFFEFYFDDHLVAQYNHEKAGPGTVRFGSQSRVSVHLDDIVISGPRIPSIGPRSVDPELNSVTTWGEIKNSSRR